MPLCCPTGKALASRSLASNASAAGPGFNGLTASLYEATSCGAAIAPIMTAAPSMPADALQQIMMYGMSSHITPCSKACQCAAEGY